MKTVEQPNSIEDVHHEGELACQSTLNMRQMVLRRFPLYYRVGYF